MSFKISDRISVFFAEVTGGNISKKTVSSLMSSIDGAHNSSEEFRKVKIPEKILSALQKKDKKHKELNIGLQLSRLYAKEAEGHYVSGIKKQETMLDEQKKIIESRPEYERSFVKNFNELGSSFYMRSLIASELQKNKIDYCSANNKLNEARGKEHALEKKIEELSEIGKGNKDRCLMQYKNHHSEEYLILEKEINARKIEIAELKSEAKRCDLLLKKTILKFARDNISQLPKEQRSLLSNIEKVISNAKSAPQIVKLIKNNIDFLESKRDDVSFEVLVIECLLYMKEASVVIGDTSTCLKEMNAKNTETERNVKKIMAEELNKLNEISTAISTPGTTSKSGIKEASVTLTDSMVAEAFSGLPDVPADKNDKSLPLESTSNNQPKRERRRLAAAN